MSVQHDSAAYYDNYVSHQLKVAFNERHWFLFRRLQDEGITVDSNVLELGCGIGVNLYLLSTVVKQGQITGADLSPKRNCLRTIATLRLK
jgi:ubiquinone/menaquinone biosynthesis C-methylase UbiE